MPRISQLPSLTSPDASDEIAIVDASAATTKKITRNDFLKGAALPADTVTTAAIQDGAVTADKINDGAVTNAKLATSVGEVGGSWRDWSIRSWSGLTEGNGNVVAKYTQIGKTVQATYQLIFGTTTNVTGVIDLTPPVPPRDNGANLPVGNLYLLDLSGGRAQQGQVWLNSNERLTFNRQITETGTNPVQVSSSSNISTNQPWAWAVNDQICFTVTYEAA